jgi:hypothetical protein
LAILFRPFGFIAPKSLNYLVFESFDFERTWWGLIRRRVVRTKFAIYIFIISIEQNFSYYQDENKLSNKILMYIEIEGREGIGQQHLTASGKVGDTI